MGSMTYSASWCTILMESCHGIVLNLPRMVFGYRSFLFGAGQRGSYSLLTTRVLLKGSHNNINNSIISRKLFQCKIWLSVGLSESCKVTACREQFELLLRLRYSSPLFRLPSAAAIKSQVHFWNTGPDQVHPPSYLVILFCLLDVFLWCHFASVGCLFFCCAESRRLHIGSIT